MGEDNNNQKDFKEVLNKLRKLTEELIEAEKKAVTKQAITG